MELSPNDFCKMLVTFKVTCGWLAYNEIDGGVVKIKGLFGVSALLMWLPDKFIRFTGSLLYVFDMEALHRIIVKVRSNYTDFNNDCAITLQGSTHIRRDT